MTAMGACVTGIGGPLRWMREPPFGRGARFSLMGTSIKRMGASFPRSDASFPLIDARIRRIGAPFDERDVPVTLVHAALVRADGSVACSARFDQVLARCRDMRRRVTQGAAAFVVLSVAGGALAGSGRTSSLSWVELPGAESCGGAGAVARAVEQRLGRPALVSPAAAAFSIEGRAERSGAGLRAVLVLRDRTGATLGKRDLESALADCSELREKVALAVALMVDPDAVLLPPPQATAAPALTPTPPGAPAGAAPALPSAPAGAAPAPPDPTSPPEPAAAPAPTVRAVVDSPPSASPGPSAVVERIQLVDDLSPPAPWRVEPTVSAAIGAGFMPSTSVGATLTTTLSPPRFWPVELYGGGWGAQTLAAGAGASARFTSAFGGAGVCPLRAHGAPFSFLMCGAGQVGIVNAEPSGFAVAHAGSLLTLHVMSDAHLSIDLGYGISARVGGSLGIALLRSQFVFERSTGQQSIFDPPWLVATADLGLAVALP